MSNVIQFNRKVPMTAALATESDDAPAMADARRPFSFDMTQPEGGFVLIDACVPLELAVEFMNILTRFTEEADTRALTKSNKQRSRKKATG